jgi:hypothetical protein
MKQSVMPDITIVILEKMVHGEYDIYVPAQY